MSKIVGQVPNASASPARRVLWTPTPERIERAAITRFARELPVKRVLMGVPIEQAVSRESLANPHALDWFVELGRQRMMQALVDSI
jgi:hypothetical protein